LISRRYSLDGKKNIAFSDDYMFSGYMPENNSLYKTKKIPFSRDTIYLENESLNASYFKLLDANTAINSTLYNVDFLKGTLLLKKSSVYRFYHGRIPEIS
jgi:hypothetical protein